MATLADEVASDMARLLGEEGRGVAVAWGQRRFRALIGNPAVEYGRPSVASIPPRA